MDTVAPATRAREGVRIAATSRPPATDIEAIRYAARLVVAEGPVRAISALERHAAGAPVDACNALLVRLAGVVQSTHPNAGLEIVDAVIARNPGAMPAWALRAALLDRIGRRREAFVAASKVVRAPEAPPQSVLSAANMLVRLGDEQRALVAARRAYEKLGRPLRNATTLLYIAQRTADWETVDRLVGQLTAAYAAGHGEEAAETPRTHVLWCADEAINIQVLSNWSRRTLPVPAGVSRPVPEPLTGRRIRVGYLSSDFREHPTSRLILGLLRHHDRSRFEVSLYCSGWDDGSTMRREVEACADHVHSVTALSDQAAAALIRSHRIDVLVELNGPTRAHRMGILCHGAAPVQIDYLGWPGSVGGRIVDYVVGDRRTVPDDALPLYPEKVIRIDRVYQINDYAARVRPPVPSRASLGLPEERPVLGMFNAINKVGTEVWHTWMRILHAVPEALLWILDPGPAARANLARAATTLGVDPARLVFAPRRDQDEHLARMQVCDLMLDPWPYGGHTSTADALFAGVPVIAMAGRNFAGRVSGALLSAAGLGSLVRPDPERYAALAVRLLHHPAALAETRRLIRERVMGTDVFDARSKAHQMEVAYRIALDRVVAGQPPTHITLAMRRQPPGASMTPATGPAA